MSDQPPEGGRNDASAPWERPGRWAHQRMDATTVDDLIARLASTDAPGESRRQRREAADPDAAVPAGELIAALSQPDPDGSPSIPDSDGSPSIGADVAASTAIEAAAPIQPSAPSEAGLATVTTDLAENGPHPTAAGTEESTIADTAALAPAADGAAIHQGEADDGGPLTHPIAVVPATEDMDGVERASILASLRRELGGEPGPAAGTDAQPPRNRRSSFGDPHQHRAWWTAGRAVVAMIAVMVLLITGTEWVIKHRADQVMADNHISAIVPDDTNISVPTVNDPAGSAQTDAAGGQTGGATAKPAGNQVYQPENILLMGSDTRLGEENAKLGGVRPGEDTTMQSDVLMIAHLSADRQHVTVLSIPRDLYIHAPTCKAWDYSTNSLSDQDYVSPYTEWKITNAFSVGGPQCTVKALQELTGMKITRVIIIDFSGFKDMVDALGGITINACRPIVDGQLGTVIATPGVQSINGSQALNLVRSRKVEGDPTNDFGRIRRQQVVLSTILRQVTNAGVLLNPSKLDSLLQAFAHNTQTDNVTLDDLLQLAQSLGNLSPSRVTFYTLPTVPDGEGEDPADIAPAVFNALVNDQPLPGEATAPATTKKTGTTTPTASRAATSASTTATSTTPELITVAPGSVNLLVVNVTGRSGVATTTMTALNELGFAVTDSDLLLPEGDVQSGTTVEYDPANKAAALTVAAAVPGSELVATPGLGDQVKLMLGSSFDGTVQAVSIGQAVITGIGSPSDDGDGTTPPASSTDTPTTPSPTQTLTTKELSAINAQTAGCV